MNVVLIEDHGMTDSILYKGPITWHAAFPPRVVLWMGDPRYVFILSDGHDKLDDAWVYFQAGFVALTPIHDELQQSSYRIGHEPSASTVHPPRVPLLPKRD